MMDSLNYLSVCSGIEAASAAWESAGFAPVAFSEIEKFPCALLHHHYPHVPNLGDMTQIDGGQYRGLVNVLVGGTPCQAFSKAGLRNGLHDARGNLTLHYVRLADEVDPDFIVWENVPGVLSDATNAFGCLIGYLAGDDDPATPGPRPAEGKRGQFWKWDKKRRVHVPKWPPAGWVVGPKRILAWRVLDCQWFSLAQRRQRVFVVASPRTSGADPRQILFEPEGVRRDTPPCRPRAEATAIAARLGLDQGGAYRWPPECLDDTTGLVTSNGLHTLAFGGNNTLGPVDVAPALTTNRGCHNPGDFEAGALLVAFPEFMSATQVAATEDLCPALGSKNTTAIAYVETVGFSAADNGKGAAYDVCPTMRARNSKGSNQCAAWTLAVAYRDFYDALRVRRLTPTECEVLMGYVKNYTNIPWRGKPSCPDGLRYRSLGNSMAVPIMRWLGRRIKMAWEARHA